MWTKSKSMDKFVNEKKRVTKYLQAKICGTKTGMRKNENKSLDEKLL